MEIFVPQIRNGVIPYIINQECAMMSPILPIFAEQVVSVKKRKCAKNFSPKLDGSDFTAL